MEDKQSGSDRGHSGRYCTEEQAPAIPAHMQEARLPSGWLRVSIFWKDLHRGGLMLF